MSIVGRLPLIFTLAIFAAGEMIFHRIGVRLLSVHSKPSMAYLLMDRGGSFMHHLTGILALVVFSWAVVVLIRDQRLLRLPDRMVLSMTAAFFLPLAAMGLLRGLPSTMVPHLNTSFGVLLLALAGGFFRQPAPLRSKLGVLYLTVPMLLHCYWLMTAQIPALAPSGSYADLPVRLFRTSEQMMVVGAFAVFFFFAPLSNLRQIFRPIPLALATGTTGLVSYFATAHYSTAQQLAYYGLGINLPPPSFESIIYLSALFFFILTICSLAARPGQERGVALGLLLVGLSGFHLEYSFQFLLTLIGVMQVIRGCRKPLAEEPSPAAAGAGPSPDDYKTYLQRLARACSSPASAGDAVVLRTGAQQVAHIRGTCQKVPFSIRLLVEGGAVRQLEVHTGEPGKEPAPVSLNRKRGVRGRAVRQRSRGRRQSMGKDAFGKQFLVRGEDQQVARALMDNGLRQKLLQQLHGWLGVWPHEGLRYISLPGADSWPVPMAEVAFSPQDADTEDLTQLLLLLVPLTGKFAGYQGYLDS